MMKTLLISVGILIVALVIKACTSGDKLASDQSRPADAVIPTKEIENDKIIVVDNVTHEDVKRVLSEFCNVYNKSQYLATPRLWTLSSSSYAITFPYDVDFATYCFAVNFLKYPMNVKWQSKVYGWATTKQGDDWITDKSINKKVMLFLAADDKEYDNVFLTTKDSLVLLSEKKNNYLPPQRNYLKNLLFLLPH